MRKAKTEFSQATPVSSTHYMDRSGKVLGEVSTRRYFCVQCHVPQEAVAAAGRQLLREHRHRAQEVRAGRQEPAGGPDMIERLKRYWKIIRRPSVHFSLGFLTIGGFIGGIIFWGAFNTAMELDQHREVLHRLPRDARQRVRRAQEHHPLHQPLRRARRLLQLPRAARLDRQDGAQDAGLQGGVGQDLRHHQYRGEVPRRSASSWPSTSGRA